VYGGGVGCVVGTVTITGLKVLGTIGGLKVGYVAVGLNVGGLVM